MVTSLVRLERKIKENNKTPLLAVTSDMEDLTTTFQIVGGDPNCCLTVLYTSASDLPDEVACWQKQASHDECPASLVETQSPEWFGCFVSVMLSQG